MSVTHPFLASPAVADFDAFYRATRTRLLVQTWALTGDRTAAAKAVRNAYVACAHHWAKVSKLDPGAADAGGSPREDWMRPLAWGRAQNRHTVPHLHRAARNEPDVAATLAAVASLPRVERKVLLLAHLSTADLPQLAREVGISQRRADRELQTAIARFCTQRGVAATDVQAAFAPLFASALAQPWPDSASLTRIGTARRRLFTGVSVGLAGAAVIGSGFVASAGATRHAGLSDLHLGSRHPVIAPSLNASALLPMASLSSLGSANGTVSTSTKPLLPNATSKTSAARVLGCLSSAGGKGVHAAQWRTANHPPQQTWVAQAVRSSATPAAAQADFNAVTTWYDACASVRLQLLRAYAVTGVGDAATIGELKNWDGAGRTVLVGVVRTGSLTGVVATAQYRTITPAALAQGLGDLTRHLCGRAGAGTCTSVGTPTVHPTSVPRLPSHPGLLSAVDLPAIPGVSQPWAGTDVERATKNLAATPCDHTRFTSAAKSLTRTFVIPSAHLASSFGLTETIGTYTSAGAAAAIESSVVSKMNDCTQNDLGSHVSPLAIPGVPAGAESVAWEVRFELSSTRSVTYYMAVIISGTHAAQLSFVPDGDHDMGVDAFAALVRRASTRLHLN